MDVIHKGVTGLCLLGYLTVFTWCTAQVLVPMSSTAVMYLAAQ